MDRYTVQGRYEAYKDGQRLGPWRKGDEVELDQDVAEHVERDCPGLLKPKRAPGRPRKQGGAPDGS
jgi:hypothetical protein